MSDCGSQTPVLPQGSCAQQRLEPAGQHFCHSWRTWVRKSSLGLCCSKAAFSSAWE